MTSPHDVTTSRGSPSHCLRCMQVRRPVGHVGSGGCGQLTVMADKGGSRSGARTGRERIKKLTQAALNADVTVEQVDAMLAGLGDTLDRPRTTRPAISMPPSSGSTTPSPASTSWRRASSPSSTVSRPSSTASNASSASAKSVMAPLAATEHAVRGAVNAVRERTGCSGATAFRRPAPPVADGIGLPWDVAVDDAVAAIAAARDPPR